MLDFLKKIWQKIKELSFGEKMLSISFGAMGGGLLTINLVIALGVSLSNPITALMVFGVGIAGAVVGGAFGISIYAVAKDLFKKCCSNNESTSSNDQTNTENANDHDPKNENQNSYQKISTYTSNIQPARSSAQTESSYLLNNRSSSESRDSILPAFITNIGTWVQRRLGIIPDNTTNNVLDTTTKSTYLGL